MDYGAFKNSTKFKHVFGGSEVGYTIYSVADTELKPIGRGSGLNVDGAIEQIPVEEYGVEIVREYVDGKYTLTGRIESFFIPSQDNLMPNTQNFRDKEYVIDMVCAGGVNAKLLKDYTYTDENGATKVMAADTVIDLSGGKTDSPLILKRWRGVKFSGKGMNQSSRGLIGMNVPFVAMREFNGDEVFNQIDTL